MTCTNPNPVRLLELMRECDEAQVNGYHGYAGDVVKAFIRDTDPVADADPERLTRAYLHVISGIPIRPGT